MAKYQLERKFLVAGEWRDSREILEVRNPYNDEVVGVTYRPTEEDVEKAVRAAYEARKETASLPTYKRSAILSGIHKRLLQRREELARGIALEAGKPIIDSRREVDRAINLLELASEEVKRTGGEFIPLDLVERDKGRVAITRRFPVGAILGITPFNFPLNLVCHKMAPALAGGNTVIIKPASATPLTALLLAKIALESGLPPRALSVLPCSGPLAEKMVRDDRLRMLTFTGSTQVGWYLKGIAGKKRVLLELGGNAGVIIDKDADLGYAAQRCSYGGYVYSGQSCISLQRIYVHEEVYRPFLDLLVKEVKTLKMGDPQEEGTQIGPLIYPGAARRLEEWIQEALSQGARLMAGGRASGNFLEPTILVDTCPDMRVNCEEVFGPLVTVSKFSSFESALEDVDRSRYGLQAGVFTSDLNKAFLAYKTLEVGTVIINDIPTFRADHMPYGGVKDSGLGREGVRYAIEEMTERRSLVLNLRLESF